MSDSTAAVVSHPDRPTLWSEAVGVLTRAIRLTRKRGDGTEEPDDFADFLATALTAAAANVGSVDRVTEGRPGSWEASHIHELLRGMVGYEDEARVLIGYRTDPVRVPLNVAQLVEDSGCLPTFDEAMRAIGWPGHGDGTFEHPIGEGATDEEWETRYSQTDALLGRYAAAFVTYAEAFRAAVDDEARAIEGLLTEDHGGTTTLRVPVEVVAEIDPEEPWSDVQNPDEWDSDPLVWRLWSAARERAGTPQLTVESGDPS